MRRASGLRGSGETAYVAATSNVILALSSELELDEACRYLVTPPAGAPGWGLETDLVTTVSALEWLAGLLLESGSVASCMELAPGAAPKDAPVFLACLGGGEQGRCGTRRFAARSSASTSTTTAGTSLVAC